MAETTEDSGKTIVSISQGDKSAVVNYSDGTSETVACSNSVTANQTGLELAVCNLGNIKTLNSELDTLENYYSALYGNMNSKAERFTLTFNGTNVEEEINSGGTTYSKFSLSETDPKFQEWSKGKTIAVGEGSLASSNTTKDDSGKEIAWASCIALGYNANANSKWYATAIGREATAGGTNSVAAGYKASATGENAIASGVSATASGENAIAIGNGAAATHKGSVSIGAGAASLGEGTLNLSVTGPDKIVLNASVPDTTERKSLKSYLEDIKKGYKLTVKWSGASTLPEDRDFMVYFADGSRTYVNPGYFNKTEIQCDSSSTFDNVIAYAPSGYDASIVSEYMNGRWLDAISITQDTTITKATTPCLLKGTWIMLADEREKKIEDLTYDDDLLVWDFDNGKFSHAKPAWIKKAEVCGYYFRNRYEDGCELLTTGRSETGWGHRHFDFDRSEFRYCPTTVGDRVFCIHGYNEHVACEKVYGDCVYYNVITESHFNMFANGILTSCSLNNFRKIDRFRFCDTPTWKCIDRDEFVKAVGSERARYYFDSLRIGEMKSEDVGRLSDYVRNMIIREVAR